MDLPDIMVDLETTGTQPEHSNIIQLAAAKFNHRTGEVGDLFDRCLIPLPSRFWDEDTRKWWSSMPKVLDGIWSRMEPAHQVLTDFTKFAQGSPTLWAKPVHFEFPFLSSYYRELGLLMPFHFRVAMDQNTFIRSRFFPEEAPPIEKELDFVGDQHNALHDVLHQIKTVLTAIERTS